jgi:type IV pilus assembly protein PilE
MRRAPRGFTLLELMVVVGIIGILSAVAIPSYLYYILRGRLPVATQGLVSMQTQLEAWFQDNRSYANAPICPSSSPPASITQLMQGSKVVFTLSATCAAATYTLTATGDATLVGGITYTLSNTGVQATTAVPSDWTLPSPSTCWVMRKDGSC